MKNLNNVKVDGYPGMVKDTVTGVISNMNVNDRDRYRIARKTATNGVETQAELLKMKSEMKELKEVKEELNELKDLIKQLLDK